MEIWRLKLISEEIVKEAVPILLPLFSENNISDVCAESLLALLNGFKRQEIWALKCKWKN